MLAAWIAHQRTLDLSVEKVRTSAKESFGLGLSEATILSMEARVAERLGSTYEQLRAGVKEAAGVNADETTSFPINGENG